MTLQGPKEDQVAFVRGAFGLMGNSTKNHMIEMPIDNNSQLINPGTQCIKI